MEVGASSLTLAQVQAAADAAAKAAMPPFSDAVPRTEMTGGSAGTAATAIPRPDHQHPRLTATAAGTLKADGTQVVAFTRTFSTKPAVNITEIDSGGNTPPADFKVQSWTQDAQGNYTGCTIYGSRSRVLPTLAPISGVLTLLSGVISATNAVFQVLSGYVPYEAAGGAQFTLIALQPTTPS